MPRCRDHCPSHGHGRGALRDLLFMVVALTALYWGAGKVAPAVDTGMARVAVVVSAVAAVTVLLVAVKLVVDRVANRRAWARYAALEEQARRGAAEQRHAPALTAAARQLEAAPTVRAEAFVDRDVDNETSTRWAA